MQITNRSRKRKTGLKHLFRLNFFFLPPNTANQNIFSAMSCFHQQKKEKKHSINTDFSLGPYSCCIFGNIKSVFIILGQNTYLSKCFKEQREMTEIK